MDSNREVMARLLTDKNHQLGQQPLLQADSDSRDSGHYETISIEECLLGDNQTKVKDTKEKPPEPPPMNQIAKVKVKFPEFEYSKEKEELLSAAGIW